MTSYSIILKYGLDSIPFGISETDLLKILGKPNNLTNVELIPGEVILVYEYNGIQFSFDQAYDYKLTEIEIEDYRYMLGNMAPIGQLLHNFLEQMQEYKVVAPKIESQVNEYTKNTLFLFYDNIGLTAIFEDYLCKRIAIYPVYDDDNNIIWP